MRASYRAALSIPIAGYLAIAGVAAPNAFGAPIGAAVDTQIATSLRLSPSQYRQTIADIFDDSIKIDGRFEPEQRDQGLLAIGERTGNITDSGLRSYYDLAQSIAAQVVDSQHRSTLIGCTPRSQTERDDACARSFFARVGPLLHRRPISDAEVEERVAAAGSAT